MSAHPDPKRYYTESEYFALEEVSETRHEFFRGEIFAMTGGSINHNRITRNLSAFFTRGLRDTACEAFTSDMRVLVEAHGLYTYPDVLVVCGGARLLEGRNDTITNPVVIVEVLSPSTQDYDRGRKFEFYRALASLRDYVLIHQDRFRVEYYHRRDDGRWLLTDFKGTDDRLLLEAIDFEIPLDRLYEWGEAEGGP